MDVCQMHDILWSCWKLSLQLWLTPTWVTGEFLGIVSTNLLMMHIHCTTLLPKQAYILLHITSNNISMMNLSSLIDYTVTKKTSFLTWWLFCGFEILVALATKQDLVAVVYTGSLGSPVAGGFPSKGASNAELWCITYFDVSLNKLSSGDSGWFGAPRFRRDFIVIIISWMYQLLHAITSLVNHIRGIFIEND